MKNQNTPGGAGCTQPTSGHIEKSFLRNTVPFAISKQDNQLYTQSSKIISVLSMTSNHFMSCPFHCGQTKRLHILRITCTPCNLLSLPRNLHRLIFPSKHQLYSKYLTSEKVCGLLFQQFWHLNSGPCAYQEDALPLEPNLNL